jgi:ribosomal protein L14E/L6E/L27E
MKKLMLLLAAMCLAVLCVTTVWAADDTLSGWVSDTKCGAKGTSEKHADCAKKCIGAGAKMALVTDSDKNVLTVDNPESLTGHEGHHVSVKGTVSGDSIKVDPGSVKMVAAKSESKDSMEDMHK